ncbi:hypothetical protein, partial [Klebsiella pneumoniae]|uniref:hypothetical protein n=1 Tax=Klebsiella pneumoniae TaxID=573 RepID=UPI00272F3706
NFFGSQGKDESLSNSFPFPLPLTFLVPATNHFLGGIVTLTLTKKAHKLNNIKLSLQLEKLKNSQTSVQYHKLNLNHY